MDPQRKPAADKRRWPRHPFRVPCDLWIKGTRHSGVVKDISRAGLFVETSAKAPPGTPLTLVFAPEQKRTEIRVTGRVMRSDRNQPQPGAENSGGIGVEVTEAGALGRLLGSLRVEPGKS